MSTDKTYGERDLDWTRNLSKQEAEKLQGGAAHYLAFVGPPQEYDLMGAMQFRLLTTLGLRGSHRILDIGCGSLRAGRLLIPYLDRENYVGVEPNQWLIEDALKYEIGRDIVAIKQPKFHHFGDFRLSKTLAETFDFVLGQSVFSHAGLDLILLCLKETAKVIKDEGLMVATFIHGDQDYQGSGWVYPGVVAYRPKTISQLFDQAGLYGAEIPWFHPRQTWYVLSKSIDKIERVIANKQHLSGAVMFVESFHKSLATEVR